MTIGQDAVGRGFRFSAIDEDGTVHPIALTGQTQQDVRTFADSGVLGLGTLFTVSSAFTLAKCVRDRQEESYPSSRVDRARVDKLLSEHDPFKVEGV